MGPKGWPWDLMVWLSNAVPFSDHAPSHSSVTSVSHVILALWRAFVADADLAPQTAGSLTPPFF